MKFDSDSEWQAWGETDPLWAVATWKGKQAGGASPWTDEAFYALGLADWNALLVRWRRYGLIVDACVEIGCGAGRMTRHLSRDFRRVEALDVSPGMLVYARERIQDEAIHFHLTSGADVPLSDGSVTAALSTYVFQHFDSLEHGRAMFAQIARVLAPGGTMLIQLPVHAWPFERQGFALWHGLRARAEHLHAALRRRLPLRPIMRGTSYPARWLFDTLPALGLDDIEVSWFDTGEKGKPSLVAAVFARKGLPG